MARCVWLVSTAFPFLSAATGLAQQAKPIADSTPIVQPGAPGQSNRMLSAAAASAISLRPPAEADVNFMQGMIMHHSQAVEMTDLLRTRSHNKDAPGVRQAHQHLADRRDEIHEAVA